MPRIQANGIDIAYEETGPADGPVVLLIMGLGAQMMVWPDPLVARLAATGFRVIRFDNRDVGQSTRLSHLKPPNALMMIGASLLRLPVPAPYTLEDMARDTLGFLDALGVARAHLVGASMGGMIAQTIAARHPERVISLSSLISTTGDPRLPKAEPKVAQRMFLHRPRTRDRESMIRWGVEIYDLIGTPDPQRSPGQTRALIERAFDRGHDPAGVRRQLAAILRSGSRVPLLHRITAPTLVIHGEADPLIPVEGGRDTARHIRGARLVIFPGMAHDLPPSRLEEIGTLLIEHVLAAERMSEARAA